MPTQKRKHDEFCRAENKHATPSEQVKNLWETLLDPNFTTNHDQNTEMQALLQ